MAEQPAMESATETQNESVVPTPKPLNTHGEVANALNNLLSKEASKTQEIASEKSTKERSDSETNIEDAFDDDELTDHVEMEETSDGNEELYKLTVNGQEVEVTLDELRKGYSRQQDYTQKTEKLSQDRKSVDQLKNQYTREFEEAKIKRDQYQQQLQILTQELQGNESNVDMDQLYREDPAEYVRYKAEQDRRKELLQASIQEQERIQYEKKNENDKNYQSYISDQRKLLSEKLPIYADKEKGPEFVKNLTNFAKEIGYTDQEISQLVDHRAVMMLASAYRYDKLKKANLSNKKITKISKVVSSSNPRVNDDSDVVRRMNSKKATLKKTGKVQDAVSILEQMYSQ
jgi:hypothetical protein